MRVQFAKFTPIFKNTNFCRLDIKTFLQVYAEEEVLTSQLQRISISSLELSNGNIITHLLLIYLQLEILCTKRYRFVEYTLVYCIIQFVQAAVNACV